MKQNHRIILRWRTTSASTFIFIQSALALEQTFQILMDLGKARSSSAIFQEAPAQRSESYFQPFYFSSTSSEKVQSPSNRQIQDHFPPICSAETKSHGGHQPRSTENGSLTTRGGDLWTASEGTYVWTAKGEQGERPVHNFWSPLQRGLSDSLDLGDFIHIKQRYGNHDSQIQARKAGNLS